MIRKPPGSTQPRSASTEPRSGEVGDVDGYGFSFLRQSGQRTKRKGEREREIVEEREKREMERKREMEEEMARGGGWRARDR